MYLIKGYLIKYKRNFITGDIWMCNRVNCKNNRSITFVFAAFLLVFEQAGHLKFLFDTVGI